MPKHHAHQHRHHAVAFLLPEMPQEPGSANTGLHAIGGICSSMFWAWSRNRPDRPSGNSIFSCFAEKRRLG